MGGEEGRYNVLSKYTRLKMLGGNGLMICSNYLYYIFIFQY